MLSARTLNGSAAKAASKRSWPRSRGRSACRACPGRSGRRRGAGRRRRPARRLVRPSGTCGGRPVARPARRRRSRAGGCSQSRQLGGGRPQRDRPAAGTQRPAGPGRPRRGVLGDGLAGGGLGVDEPLVGDVQVGQQDVGRRVVRVDAQGSLGLRPAGGQAVALQVGLPSVTSTSAASGLICWRASARVSPRARCSPRGTAALRARGPASSWGRRGARLHRCR